MLSRLRRGEPLTSVYRDPFVGARISRLTCKHPLHSCAEASSITVREHFSPQTPHRRDLVQKDRSASATVIRYLYPQSWSYTSPFSKAENHAITICGVVMRERIRETEAARGISTRLSQQMKGRAFQLASETPLCERSGCSQSHSLPRRHRMPQAVEFPRRPDMPRDQTIEVEEYPL
ncbi:hypothetical protein BDV96DRAFT_564167 [Lophiotrema nucula]|uniref:Uncharacterized protein n=1 Tax=Lophiotrema nucula TaxID=690887 RepID=A0A6A5ZRA1_9PLEO|nr:hypothetical protein BDV96DRAFT_564167 [Lophiotrema nucula]